MSIAVKEEKVLKKEEEKDVSTESSEGHEKGVEAELKGLTTNVEWRRISSMFLSESVDTKVEMVEL